MTSARFSAQPADTGPLPPRARARRLRRRPRRHACGAAPGTTSSSTPSPRCATSTTGAPPAPSPLVGDGAGILTQVPDAFLRGVVRLRAARPAARTPWAPPSCPSTTASGPRPSSAIEAIAAEEGLRVLGWRDVPVDARPRRARRPAPACRSSAQLFVAPSTGRESSAIGARPARLLPAQARRARARGLLPVAVRAAPWSTRACSPPASSSRSSPTCPTGGSRPSSRWCTRGSRPTPSRRWPLAHPYRLIAHNGEINTVKGNRNWMRGPREPARLRPHPGRPRAALPDLHARALATRRPSTRCSSCCTSAAARCRTRC